VREAHESKDVFNVNDVRKSLSATEPAGAYVNDNEAKESLPSNELAQDDVPVRKKYVPPHLRGKN